MFVVSFFCIGLHKKQRKWSETINGSNYLIKLQPIDKKFSKRNASKQNIAKFFRCVHVILWLKWIWFSVQRFIMKSSFSPLPNKSDLLCCRRQSSQLTINKNECLRSLNVSRIWLDPSKDHFCYLLFVPMIENISIELNIFKQKKKEIEINLRVHDTVHVYSILNTSMNGSVCGGKITPTHICNVIERTIFFLSFIYSLIHSFRTSMFNVKH